MDSSERLAAILADCYELKPERVRVESWLDRGSGQVHVFLLPARSQSGLRWKAGAPARHFALAPQGGRFSSELRVIPSKQPAHGVPNELLLEPRSRELWRVMASAEQAWLAPVALPDGGALLGWHALTDTRLLDAGSPAPLALALQGERGSFVLDQGVLRRMGEHDVPVDEAERRATVRVRLADPDWIAPLVEVTGPRGEVLFRHRRRPEGAPRRALHAGIQALTLARSPLSSLAAYLGDADPAQLAGHMFLEPLTAGGRRGWLVALHVAVALLVAAAAGRKVGGPRGWAWGVALALVGPALYLVLWLVEPRRRRRAPAAGVRRAPRTLIATA